MRNRSRRARVRVAVLALVATLVPTAPVAVGAQAGAGPRQEGSPAITVTELPPLEGRRVTPFAINERGQVAAWTEAVGGPFTTRGEVQLHDRGRWVQVSPPASRTIHLARPTALTERGDVGGAVTSADGFPGILTEGGFAWLGGRLAALDAAPPGVPPVRDVNERRQVLFADQVWRGGEVTVAPAPPEGTTTAFASLSNAGQAVGTRPGPPPVTSCLRGRHEAVLWQIGGSVTPLGIPAGSTSSRAVAVTDAGVVAGTHHRDEGGICVTRTWVWQRGRMVDLGTLGGRDTRIPEGPEGRHNVNARGEVVGLSDVAPDGPSHAFYWTGGRMVDLGTLDGGTSQATAVNNRGQVVGISQSETDPGPRAFLWQDGRMVDLTALVPDAGPYTYVHDINDRGQILGRTWDPATGEERTLLWTVSRR